MFDYITTIFFISKESLNLLHIFISIHIIRFKKPLFFCSDAMKYSVFELMLDNSVWIKEFSDNTQNFFRWIIYL